MANFVEVQRHSSLFVIGDLEALTPPNSVARVIWAALADMDFSEFEAMYTNDHSGRPAVHPRCLAAVWLLGLVRGVTSSVQLEALCASDVEFRWLLGDAPVKKSTLCAFRTQGEALSGLCSQVLAGLARSGLLPGESVGVDGTVIRAAASCSSVTTPKKLRKRIQRLQEKVEKTLEEATENDGAERVEALEKRQARLGKAMEEIQALGRGEEESYTVSEPDARKLKLKKGGCAPAYNIQISADLHTGAIVHSQVSKQSNDAGQLKPQADEARAALVQAKGEDSVRELVADGGYHDARQLVELEQEGVHCVVPDSRNANRIPPGVSEEFRAECFTYDPDTDTMTCPAGHVLCPRATTPTSVTYQANKNDCAACPHKAQCCPKAKQGRSVNRSIFRQKLDEITARLATHWGKQRSSARWTVSEGIYARLIGLLSLERFRTWGRTHVHAEVLWRELAHNLMLLTGQWRPLVYKMAEAA